MLHIPGVFNMTHIHSQCFDALVLSKILIVVHQNCHLFSKDNSEFLKVFMHRLQCCSVSAVSLQEAHVKRHEKVPQHHVGFKYCVSDGEEMQTSPVCKMLQPFLTSSVLILHV